MARKPRSVRLRLLDILDAIQQSRSAAEGLSLEAFSQSWMIRSATERAIEIISEASKHIPSDLKNEASQIPWRDVADIGNVLRHDYEKVDPRIVWSTLQKDFGPLENAIHIMLAKLPSDPS